MIKILHITPHLGGGVGTVILNWLVNDKKNLHSVITLDYANEYAKKMCKDKNIDLISQPDTDCILKKISESDITIIHFWNHPLLYDFLVRNALPESRIAIWTHISGAKPPQVINPKLLDICDKLIFTTPISYNYFKNDKKVSCILSTGGTEKFVNIKKTEHKGYNIGYIGTVDYAKMHPDYIKTISATNADKIYITGRGSNENDFKSLNDSRFIVTGWIENTESVLKELDVFAYMLNSNHYGTAEQVLQEAMSAGVVPVVLNNACEKSLIKHLETGLIAENQEEYIRYINLLKNDTELRTKLGNNAKDYAINNFSLNNLENSWNDLFSELMQVPKTSKKWNTNTNNITSYDIFMESLGGFSDNVKSKSYEELKEIFNTPEWTSETKGSYKQYYKFLGGEGLKQLTDVLN